MLVSLKAESKISRVENPESIEYFKNKTSELVKLLIFYMFLLKYSVGFVDQKEKCRVITLMPMSLSPNGTTTPVFTCLFHVYIYLTNVCACV